MDTPAFQDFYPDSTAHCYGCGRLNDLGLSIRTRWEGDESVTRFRPRPEHTATPGFVYGGLIASLLDCHGTATAAAAMYRHEGRPMDSVPAFRFVTASLQVDYLRPTPIDCELEIRGRAVAINGRRVTVEATLAVDGVVTARGRIVAAQMPDPFRSPAT